VGECNDWIRRNVAVFSKELPLKLAYEIPGLRAVFGEAYPDPVRVVALQFDVTEIAKDIQNDKWRETSVEFCGGTHVARTGDIKTFTITEESGIAKGIRRIIAITGDGAQEAEERADVVEGRLKQILSLSGKARDMALQSFGNELDQLDSGLLRKESLRHRYKEARKEAVDIAKIAEKAHAKQVIDAITSHFASNLNARVFVQKFQVGQKAIGSGTVAASKAGKSVYLFAVDPDDPNKVHHANYMAKVDASSNWDAREWLSIASDIIGGKGGGKGDTAKGTGTEPGKIDEAMEAVREAFTERVEQHR